MSRSFTCMWRCSCRGGVVLSDETFRLQSFQGQESVSSPFEYTLTLHGNTTSASNALQFANVVGASVTVGIQYPGEQGSDALVQQFKDAIQNNTNTANLAVFNGMITSFASDIPGVYRISMKPALYRLSLTNGYQVYSQINVSDLISQLMKKHQINCDVSGLLSNSAAVCRQQDWLQVGESDYALLERLLAKANIYYYFVHSPTGHQVVFANQPHYLPVYANNEPLRYTHTDTEALGQLEAATLISYSYQQSLTSTHVQGLFTRQEEAWAVDPLPGFQSYSASYGRSGRAAL